MSQKPGNVRCHPCDHLGVSLISFSFVVFLFVTCTTFTIKWVCFALQLQLLGSMDSIVGLASGGDGGISTDSVG